MAPPAETRATIGMPCRFPGARHPCRPGRGEALLLHGGLAAVQ